MSGTSYRVDETYIKVGKTYKYLYRAVDKEGQTFEFMLSAKRDVSAAKRFFKKMMRAEHRRLPFQIGLNLERQTAMSAPLSRAGGVCRKMKPPHTCGRMKGKWSGADEGDTAVAISRPAASGEPKVDRRAASDRDYLPVELREREAAEPFVETIFHVG